MQKDQVNENRWMRNLVLIAKNTYIWLYQLSRKYKKPINKLNQIPFEELEFLRSLGINGIWLIGIWERSPASKKIKELYGKEESIASAYSIYEYKIANDLGGEAALQQLRQKEFEALMAEGYQEMCREDSSIVAESRALQAAATEGIWEWDNE